MATKIVMPRLSLTMKEGTVGKWYKKEGETIEKNEPVVEILSEKATYDLEAPASGILRKIYIREGATAQVDEVLALIAIQDEAIAESKLESEAPEEHTGKADRALASPAARRLARELNVDVSLVKGSGPEGRIVEGDIRRFAEEGHESQVRIKEVIPLDGFRKVSAERVSASFKTAPHSTLFMEADISRASELHEQHKVSYTAIVLKAVATALKEHSLANSRLVKDKIEIFEDVNIGVATATSQGLVVPVVHNACGKNLQEIDSAVIELAAKARNAKLTKEDLTGGTFTITNLGMYGVEFFTPIINPPEAAILGIGAIREKPVVTNGTVKVKPVMGLSLSYDHRIIDGAPAADFLRKVKEEIEKILVT
jgi:pyruvate dehydrogenase E2 component (dihydrolipoamide acetyltransferase)